MKKLLAILILSATPTFAADITITVPDALLPRVVDGLCGAFNYDMNHSTSPVDETRGQFSQRMAKGMVRQAVINYEAGVVFKNAQTASDAAIGQIQTEVDF